MISVLISLLDNKGYLWEIMFKIRYLIEIFSYGDINLFERLVYINVMSQMMPAFQTE